MNPDITNMLMCIFIMLSFLSWTVMFWESKPNKPTYKIHHRFNHNRWGDYCGQ